MFKLYGDCFNGNEVSDYGKEHGYLDYGTLAKGFDAVLNNEIIHEIDDWEFVSGDAFAEVFQWYIVSDSFSNVLEDIGEVVWYNERLDMYLWGVTHYGTHWDYVLTNVPINQGEKAFED